MNKNKVKKILRRIIQVNLNPNSEWKTIKTESCSSSYLIKSFIFPSTTIVALITFLGYFLASGIYNYSVYYAIIKSLSVFCLTFFTPIVASLIINEIISKLGFKPASNKTLILITYSLTALWFGILLSGIIANYKQLASFVKFLGLFGILPLWYGCDLFIGIPVVLKNKFVLISIGVTIVVMLLIDWSFGPALRAAHFAEMLNGSK
jgi:hypothetical protein